METNKAKMKKPLTVESLANTLEGLCQCFGKTVTKELLQIWQRILSGFSQDEFDKAIFDYMIGPQGGFMPQPGQIYALARPEMDKDGEAQLMVERLFLILGICGENDSEKAQSKLNEISWAYIQNIGGWSKFANDMQMTDMRNMPNIKAHARNSIISLMDRKKAGRPLLLANEHKEGFSSISHTVNKFISQGVLKDVPSETD